jgi:hypothetical protein
MMTFGYIVSGVAIVILLAWGLASATNAMNKNENPDKES